MQRSTEYSLDLTLEHPENVRETVFQVERRAWLDAHIPMMVQGKAKGVYVGPRVNGLSQFNVLLPPGTRTGLVPVEVFWAGLPLTGRAWMRVIPAGPSVPRIESVTDGTNLLSERRIERGSVKVQMEEVANPELFEAQVDGLPVRAAEMFCTDPRNQRYDVSFLLPEETGAGWHTLEIQLGARKLAPIPIEVV